MAHRKTAIAISQELLDAVDLAARERGQSRSAFISRVLRAAVKARRDAEITRRLDALFADDLVADAARRDVEELEELASDWSDERW